MAGDWRDIYSYLISDTPQNIGDVVNSGGGDDPRGTSGPLPLGTGKWNGYEYQVPDKYKGIIDVQHTAGGGEDPKSSSSINIDWAKLPNGGMTPFGRVDRTIAASDPTVPLGPGQKNQLKDPKLVYNDPNFGWITPASNRKTTTQDKIFDILPYAVMAAAGAGLGFLPGVAGGGFPSWAKGLIGGAKFLGGQVGPGSVAPSAAVAPSSASVAPSSMNRGISSALTPQAIQLLRMARGG